MGAKFKLFKRTNAVELPSDYYESEGIFIYYKQPGLVEAVEATKPSVPIYDGLRLLEESYRTVKRHLRSHDFELAVEADGLISKKLGIAIYAPDATIGGNSVPEGVTVFADGYYD
jgi:hypothetical protein